MKPLLHHCFFSIFGQSSTLVSRAASDFYALVWNLLQMSREHNKSLKKFSGMHASPCEKGSLPCAFHTGFRCTLS